MFIILVVHECAEERDRLSRILRGEHFDVVIAPDDASGLKMFYETRPDLVLMSEESTSLPAEVLGVWIREAGGIPFIVFGKRDDRVKWLGLGADAYLSEPSSTLVLVARVRSLLRNHKRHLDHNAKSSSPDLPNDLTSTENRLLSCLQSGEGKSFSYSQLLIGVWGNKEVTLDTLHYYMRRLQRKIGSNAIVLLRGIGYRFSRNGMAGNFLIGQHEG